MESPEVFRHLVKIADLDGLEGLVTQSTDLLEVAHDFEVAFNALDKRAQLSDEVTIEWGRRYIEWANGFSDRDGLPVWSTTWARRTIELAMGIGDSNLALQAATMIMHSYATASEKERNWWMKMHYRLANGMDIKEML